MSLVENWIKVCLGCSGYTAVKLQTKISIPLPKQIHQEIEDRGPGFFTSKALEMILLSWYSSKLAYPMGTIKQ